MPGQVLAILFGFGFCAAVCYSAGRMLLSRLGVRLYAEERPLFAFVSGSACVSFIVFVLAAAGAVYPGVFLALGLLIAAGALRARLPACAALPRLPLLWKALYAIVFIAYLAFYLSQALGPEYSPDGSTYHLGYVARYLRQHGFGRITTSLYANLSQGLEMLFLFAFAFGRHSAAALVHFAFFIALTLGMVAYSRRFGFPRAGIFAAILVYASPVFGYDGTVAYNDVAAACVAFFVFYALQIWAHERQHALLFPVGLMAGFSYAIKYTAGVAAVYAVAFVVWRSRELRRALPVCCGAALMIAPWTLKNWIVVGNPFSPLFNRWFPNPYVSAALERDYIRLLTHVDGYSAAARFLDTVYRAGPTGAILGFVFLLTPWAALALRERQGRQLLLAAGIFGAACGFNIQTRFLLPVIPFISLALGLALMRIPMALAALLVAHAILCWPSVVRRYCDSGLRVRHFLPRQALRIEPEESTLAFRLPGYRTARMVEALTPPEGRVFSFATPAEAYTSRELLIYYESTFNQSAYELLSLAASPDLQPDGRTVFVFPRQPLRGVRILQTSQGSGNSWSVADVHILDGERELARQPQWLMSAQPNPFEIANAFDGNPATSWSSRQPIESGMRVEVRFAQPEWMDGVAIDGPRGQYDVRLALEGEAGGGGWKELSREPRRFNLPATEDYRLPATRELKRRSITHLLIAPAFPGARNMQDHPAAWGVRFLGEAEGSRLYAID